MLNYFTIRLVHVNFPFVFLYQFSLSIIPYTYYQNHLFEFVIAVVVVFNCYQFRFKQNFSVHSETDIQSNKFNYG